MVMMIRTHILVHSMQTSYRCATLTPQFRNVPFSILFSYLRMNRYFQSVYDRKYKDGNARATAA